MLQELIVETTADSRLIAAKVSSAQVVAVLSPQTTSMSASRSSERTVLDVAVLHLAVADTATAQDRARLCDLLMRAMPRPLVLLTTAASGLAELSVAVTRASQVDAARSVIEVVLTVDAASAGTSARCFAPLDRTDLWSWYSDVARRLAAGDAKPNGALTAGEALRSRLELHRLAAELIAVQRRLQRTKQMQERIDLNREAKRIRAKCSDVGAALYAPE
ncbi:DUF4391 domain-containing protein [Agrococcus sp. ARC_14]|nr:DUF4391 domain-containing protein [Agrococcus sp. ARC_14]